MKVADPAMAPGARILRRDWLEHGFRQLSPAHRAMIKLTRRSPAPAVDGRAPTLYVIFAFALSESDMRCALLGADGTIVQGPTPEGIYTVGIAPGSMAGGGIEGLRSRLRADSRVRLAEYNYQAVSR